MAIAEKSVTFKVKWQVVSSNIKSQEIELAEGIRVCFGVKNNLFHHTVYLVSKTTQPCTLEISEVFFATCSAPEQRRQMNLVTNEGPTWVFSAEVADWKAPLALTCWLSLKVKDSVKDFSHQIIDSHLSSQLWTAAKLAQLTDVEVHVGQPSRQKVFHAHRSILAARSAIFAGQFEKDPSLNKISIEDVHHSIFKEFLRFLYTGQLKVTAVSNLSELLTLADRYQIAALQSLCHNPVHEMNASELTSLIISLNNPSTSRSDSFNYKSSRSTQASPTTEAIYPSNVNYHERASMQHGQTQPSPNNQERSETFGFSGPISTSSDHNYCFSKAVTSSGPMSFCFTNPASSTVMASPVPGAITPLTYQSPISDPNSSSSTPVGKTRTLHAFVNASTPAEGVVQFNANSRNASKNNLTGQKAENAKGSKTMSLKASVVANAVHQLHLIFDEMMAELSTTSTSSDSDNLSESSPQAAPPPTSASSSQRKTFALLPSRLNTSASASPSLGPPSFSEFSFPSITKQGKFGKPPLKSPLVGLPWKSDRVPDGQSNSAVASPSGSCNANLMSFSSQDNVSLQPSTPHKNQSMGISEAKDGQENNAPSSSLCSEMLRSVMEDNSNTTALSI